MTLELDVVTLFPGYFDWLRETRPVRNAVAAGSLALRTIDLRGFGLGDYRQADDAPYGGGAGMVIRVDVVCAALEATYGGDIDAMLAARRVAVLTPVGRELTDAVVTELAGLERLTLLSGRYEGFDQRVHDHLANDEISVGRYILSGGEIAAMAVIDAVTRKLEGALGKRESHEHDSYSEALAGLPEYPHYTRPERFRGWGVPDVLRSGNHAAVARWRREASAARGAAQGGSDL
ncbi:MAG TPA: tRNA (guanosine(37)-N1)-methyltransferase TrmD [Gaiellales bacterium]|nr:tRNA (guanosine(37)-N1)-methyltransferase TrmD [Gaiellales bacterium]